MHGPDQIDYRVSWETTSSPGVAVSVYATTDVAMLSVVSALCGPGVVGVVKVTIEPLARMT